MSYPPEPPGDGDQPGPEPGTQPGIPPGHEPRPQPGPPPGYQPGPQPGYGQQYGYGPGYPPGYPAQYGYGQVSSTNNKATTSLIIGISTLVLSWCCGFGIAGVVAIVLGVKARNEIRFRGGAQSGEGMALGGIITGAFAVLFGLAAIVILIVAIATGGPDYKVDGGGTSF